MWKFQEFSVAKILREINFRKSRSPKTAVFAICGALNFVDLVKFSVQKLQKFKKSKLGASKINKMVNFLLLETP